MAKFSNQTAAYCKLFSPKLGNIIPMKSGRS